MKLPATFFPLNSNFTVAHITVYRLFLSLFLLLLPPCSLPSSFTSKFPPIRSGHLIDDSCFIITSFCLFSPIHSPILNSETTSPTKMVKTSASPSSSPVTITVSSAGKGSGSRSMGLTSPVPRASVSNNPNSPLSGRGNRASIGGRRASGGGNCCSMSKDDEMDEINSEYVTYTVHIPPTPERQTLTSSQTSLDEDPKIMGKPDRSYISGTIFTGGFNSVTRGHVIDCSVEREETVKSGSVCGMKGCDEEAMEGKFGGPCECGFKICRDCYLEWAGNGGGRCPGCKEPFKHISDDEEGQISEEEDQALPLPSMAEFKLDKRLSVVKSFKAQNHPPEFDHTRWLFETKGTYGYGNAVWPKDGYDARSGAAGFENPPDFREKTRKPLTRKVGVSAAILSPYR